MSPKYESADLEHAKGVERNAWLTLWRTYERCVEISERVWEKKLDAAQLQQAELAGGMHRRESEIQVPSFTPRDRAQFVKEVAATLLISADRRQLNVRFPKEKPTDVETKPEAENGTSIEAASGTAEEAMDIEAGQLSDASGTP